MGPTLIKKLIILVVVVGVLIGVYRLIVPRNTGPNEDGILGRPLRVGIVTWPGYAGGIAANNGFKPNTDCIFWRAHNLKVEFMLLEDTDTRAKAFGKGGKNGVDIVWSTVDFWANELPGFISNGIGARAILQVDWSRGGDAIVADDSIQRIEDLKGKRISLAQFTPSHWLLAYSLEHSDLTEAEREQIFKTLAGKPGSPDARDDFIAGKADAAVVWEPDVTYAVQKRPGSHILLDTKTRDHLIADVMVAREDFIKEHPDVIMAFVKGWLDGTAEANRKPEVVTKLLMENEPTYKALGEEATRKGLAKVKWATLYDNTAMFGLDGSQPLFDVLFKDAGIAWAKRGYITAPMSPTEARDARFVNQIYNDVPVNFRATVIRDEDIFPATPPASVTSQPAVSTERFNVFFDTGKAEPLNPQVLDEIMKTPLISSNAYIRVEGNTDNVGNKKDNQVLSMRRAQAVIDQLVNKYHFKRERFVPIGNGDTNPLDRRDTPEARAKNRRTDVMLLKRE